uniref:Uncharacterized protein n=1 Tax=Romanomermis culicivorax TaxID=13658 RepID=A0A915JAY3_ROMCU
EQHISDLHGKFEEQEPGNNFQNFNICQEIPAKKRRILDFDVENDENLIKKRLTNNRLLYNILNEQAPKVRWRTSIVRRRLAENEIYRSILRENGEKLVTDEDEKAKNASPSANEDRRNFDEPNFKCTFCYAEFKSKATLK